VCQPENGQCTAGADCCTGLRCEVPQGSITGSCQPGALCSSGGQACSPNSPCCPGMSCRSASGVVCDGTTSCTCRVIIN
jgi:hypothetical protein